MLDSTVEAQITTVPTPNPNALMFRVDETLVPTGTYEFTRDDTLDDSPLAAQLLALQGVELVLIAPRFVTVNKHAEAPWPDVVPAVKQAMRTFLSSGEMAVFDTRGNAEATNYSEIERRIIALIDEEIRPAIAQDGGDIAFMGFVDGIVHLRMSGACGTCPSSTATLKMGIERMLMEEFPEVQGVEQAF